MEKRNKLQTYILAGIIILVLVAIIALFVIWRSDNKKTSNVTNLNLYQLSDFKAKTYDIYSNEIKRLLLPQNTDQLFEKMQSAFLTEYKLNKDNFKKYVQDNHLVGQEIKYTNYTVIQKEDTFIYRITYSVYDNNQLVGEKIVNVIEDRPYHYTLSFDQESVSVIENLKLNSTSNDIKFDISCIQSTSNGIKFKIIITNNNEKDIRVDFDNITNVVLVLNDNSLVKMAGTVISADDEILTNGSMITKEAYFAIGLERQGKIKAINFGNVIIGNEHKVITLNF